MNKKRIQQIKCLFTLFFVVCASFYATRSYAQNNAVTIRLSGVSMERVMNEIENQTNYLFLSNKDVDINSVVSVDVEARPLSEALAQMVRGTDVVYRFDGKYILLSKADRRPVTVKGVVTDADGAPVIGASVIVKGTTVGASTNTDGACCRWPRISPIRAAKTTERSSYDNQFINLKKTKRLPMRRAEQ